jgi:LmbE family N-acetylglucosaminyl deacetylase
VNARRPTHHGRSGAPRRVLAVVAHPDDEVLGCGGTLARLAGEGGDVRILILGEGITSRQARRDVRAGRRALAALRRDAREAARLLGARSSEVLGFPDNRFDALPLLDLVKAVGRAVEAAAPDLVLTHFAGDLNVDHRLTCQAVLTACRPLPGAPAREILSFEVPSSTEWQTADACVPFAPRQFVVLTARHVATKVAAMEAYASERRPFPHPRSPEAVRALARWRGASAGVAFAEAFSLVRRIV